MNAQFSTVRDGHRIHGWIDPLRDGTGTTIGTTGLAIDQGVAIDRLAQVEADGRWYSTLIETFDGIFYEVDIEEGRYTYVSHHAEEMTDYPTEQWLNDPGFWLNHLHPDDFGRILAELGRLDRVAKPSQIQYRMRTAAGGWLLVENFFALHRNEAG